MNASLDWICNLHELTLVEKTEAVPDLDSAMPRDDEPARRTRLIDWVRDNGGLVDTLTIDACDDARGIRAAGDIAEGTQVVRIPQKLFITALVAKESRIGARLAATGRDISERAMIAAFLLEARRDGSFWSPYVDTLPRSFPEHVLSFGPLELMAIHALSAVGCVLQAIRRLHGTDFASVADVLAEEGFDQTDFEWAWCCVRTRAYKVSFDSGIRVTLIPLADMCNHVNAPATRGSRPDRADYVITADRFIAAGKEVTASYGEFSNAELLSGYGFCLDDNEFDSAILPLPSCNDMVIVPRKYATPVVRDAFGQIRLSIPLTAAPVASPDQSIAVEPAVAMDGSTPFDIDHELACLNALHQGAQTALFPFNRCLAKDDPARAAAVGHANLRAVLTAIESEKKVLLHFSILATTASQVLRDRGANAKDKALLTYIDPDYAAEIVKLIERQGGTP